MNAKPTDITGVVSDTLGAVNGSIDLVQNVNEVAQAGADFVGNVFGDDGGGARTVGGGSVSKNAGAGAALLAGSSHGGGSGSSCPVSVDQAIKQPVVDYCQDQSDAMARIADHLVTYCTLDGSFGLLLGVFLKPMYQQSRDRAFTAIGNVRGAVDALTHQFECAMTDYEDHEENTKEMLKQILAEIEELKAGQTAGGGIADGGGGYGGGGGGGYGGGGYGGYGGGYAPPPPPSAVFPEPTGPDPQVNVSVHVDADGEVDVDIDVEGNSGDVHVDVDVDVDQDDNLSSEQPEDDYPDGSGDASNPSVGDAEGGELAGGELAGGELAGGGGVGGIGLPSATTPGEATAIATDPINTDPIATDPIDGVIPATIAQEEPLTAEQQAERADFYDQIWREQSAKDPLGRTADQLRLAWENRESIVLDETLVSGRTTLGYGDSSVIATPTVDFSIVHATQGARA